VESKPDDFKPMPLVGKGVEEIRVTDEGGAYRVIYVARRAEAVYVLHAFQKKTQAPEEDTSDGEAISKSPGNDSRN
jgi:phage-related protein